MDNQVFSKKILLCTWGSICEFGIKKALDNLKYNYIVLDKKSDDMDYDKDYLTLLANTFKSVPDINIVLSVNYIPIIARVCNLFKIKYISIVVDCPSTTLFSKTVSYDTNHIYTFDKSMVEKFHEKCNIEYSPLAADINNSDITITEKDMSDFGCDISFIGTLYTEKCKYYAIENKLSEYTKGYIRGLVNAQQNIYGYNLIEDSISTKWAEDFRKEAGLGYMPDDYEEDIKSIVADLYIGYLCTEQERINITKTLSSKYNYNLWTTSDTSKYPDVNNRGIADSQTMMPYIFKCSKINLNITLKTIKTGIPQRVFDIMALGGFVISNYQPDILDYFTPGEDIVLYESIPDLIEKIDYYLNHEDERLQIANNGYEKVKKYHSYETRLKEWFD